MNSSPHLQYSISKARVWYLEMKSRPHYAVKEMYGIKITPLEKPVSCEHYRKLYYGVGEKWNWLDRMVMEDVVLYEKINSADTEIFVLEQNEKVAGYVELIHRDNFSELQYFGLFPDFVGRGLGKYFLQWSILKAWTYAGTEKVLVNTCSLDHENALTVYKSCGFSIVKEQEEERKVRI